LNDLFLIWSMEHGAWWRPGRVGYTEKLADAGQYSRAEACEIVARANYPPGVCHECMIPLSALVAQWSITCPRCGRESWNLHDVVERYCGACHGFHDEGSI
jgi:hypothetical protein